MKSHEKFAAKFSLPFELIPDEDHKIAEAYGVWQQKSMWGRKYMGVVRSTFIIDEAAGSKYIPQGDAQRSRGGSFGSASVICQISNLHDSTTRPTCAILHK